MKFIDVINILLNAFLILIIADVLWIWSEELLDGHKLGFQKSDLFIGSLFSLTISYLMYKLNWYLIHIELNI